MIMERTDKGPDSREHLRRSRFARFANAIVISVISMCIFAAPVPSKDASQLKQLICDAQAANLGKFESGTMDALVTVTHKGRESLRMETKVRWNGKTRFWEYRISDPGAIYRPPKSFDAPLDEAPLQYMLRTPDKVITADSRINKIVVQEIGPRGRFARSELFDITPVPLWTICCSPYLQDGQPWKTFLDKPMGEALPNDEVHFEQRNGGMIRLSTRRPTIGYTATLDFSLSLGGNLVRLESDKGGKPKDTWFITNEWVQEGDFVRLVRSKTFLGGKDESTADIVLDVQVRSMRPGSDGIPLSLETIVAKMPKNVQIADLIRNKTTFADPSAKGNLTDAQLRSLSSVIKTGEFLK